MSRTHCTGVRRMASKPAAQHSAESLAALLHLQLKKESATLEA